MGRHCIGFIFSLVGKSGRRNIFECKTLQRCCDLQRPLEAHRRRDGGDDLPQFPASGTGRIDCEQRARNQEANEFSFFSRASDEAI